MSSRGPVIRLTLPPGLVEVWRVPLEADFVGDAQLTGLLSSREAAYARRLRRGGPEWATTRGALRWVLAHHTGKAGAEVVIGRAPNGKPALAGGSGPHFSLSHTEGLALIAVASDRPVGVDVERVDPGAEIEGVTRDYLTPAARGFVRAAFGEHRVTAFHDAWVRQEARQKLTGRGLVEAAHASTPPDRLIVVRRLDVGSGHAAAVAAEGGSWRAELRDLRAAL
jgi:4'-phosphopantetheinyl transferase